jgi:hypothetical protein
MSLRERLAREDFRDSPRAERLRAYEELVETGRLRANIGFPIDRIAALRMAAEEGFPQFEKMLLASQRDLPPPTSAPEEAWRMRLTNGADNWRHGISVLAIRLQALSDAEFFRSMHADEAFRGLVLREACRDCARFGRP